MDTSSPVTSPADTTTHAAALPAAVPAAVPGAMAQEPSSEVNYQWVNALISGDKVTAMAILNSYQPDCLTPCLNILVNHFGMAGASALRRMVTSQEDHKLCAEILVDRLKGSNYPGYMAMYARLFDYTVHPERVIIPQSARVEELGHYDVQFPHPQICVSMMLATFLEGWEAVSPETLMLTMALLNDYVSHWDESYGHEVSIVALSLARDIETDDEMRDALESLISIVSMRPTRYNTLAGQALSVAICRKLMFHGPANISPAVAYTDKDVNDAPTWDWDSSPSTPSHRKPKGKDQDCLPSDIIDPVLNGLKHSLVGGKLVIDDHVFLTIIHELFPALFRSLENPRSHSIHTDTVIYPQVYKKLYPLRWLKSKGQWRNNGKCQRRKTLRSCSKLGRVNMSVNSKVLKDDDEY